MKEDTTIDKTNWPDGPAKGEADRYEWKYNGVIPCLLIRDDDSGCWEGFVTVEPGHPWFGKPPTQCLDQKLGRVDVHGGIDRCRTGDDDRQWLVGFGCDHKGDGSPMSPAGVDSYRDAGYAAFELELVADTAGYLKAHAGELEKQVA